LQLQGELIARSAPSQLQIYKSAPHAISVIAKAEGIRGLQRGLFPAYMYQICMNGVRLGTYEPTKAVLTEYVPVELAAPISGFVCGASAAFLGSPLFLIKTRMQAFSSDPRLRAVGTQHEYRGTWHATQDLVKTGGFAQLWRGCAASMMRTAGT
jgi:solute carrier family 25 protein 34/35